MGHMGFPLHLFARLAGSDPRLSRQDDPVGDFVSQALVFMEVVFQGVFDHRIDLGRNVRVQPAFGLALELHFSLEIHADEGDEAFLHILGGDVGNPLGQQVAPVDVGPKRLGDAVPEPVFMSPPVDGPDGIGVGQKGGLGFFGP